VGMTLADACRSGIVSNRVNKFFNPSVFVPAPSVPDGGLIDGKYPASGGGTTFGNPGRNILSGPDQQDFDIAAIKTIPLTNRLKTGKLLMRDRLKRPKCPQCQID
jgi:hypothetical protein